MSIIDWDSMLKGMLAGSLGYTGIRAFDLGTDKVMGLLAPGKVEEIPIYISDPEDQEKQSEDKSILERFTSSPAWNSTGVITGAYLTHHIIKKLEAMRNQDEIRKEVKRIEEQNLFDKTGSVKCVMNHDVDNEEFIKLSVVKSYIDGFSESIGINDPGLEKTAFGWLDSAEMLTKALPIIYGALPPTGWILGRHMAKMYYPDAESDLPARIVFKTKKKKKKKSPAAKKLKPLPKLVKRSSEITPLTGVQMAGGAYMLKLLYDALGTNRTHNFLGIEPKSDEELEGFNPGPAQKALIGVGAGLGLGGAAYAGYNNWDAIKSLFDKKPLKAVNEIKKAIKKK